MKIVILAGGTGTRFWPMSRLNKPKQFCAITSKEPMIKCTYDRYLGTFKKSDIYIACNEGSVPQMKKILRGLDNKNLIIEPERRDTAPAMGYAAAFLAVKFPDEPLVFAPSDHYFVEEKKFLKSLLSADKLIRKTGKMLDIGAVPSFPSTTLGYTKIGKPFQKENGCEVYKFLGHTEKPEYKKAKKYLATGNYLWHVNYYMWTPTKFLEAYKKYHPKTHKNLIKIKELFEIAKKTNNYNQKEITTEYKKMEKISFDYAITEKMNPKDVLIIKSDLGWSDIGAWDILYDKLAKNLDKDNNLVKADWCGVETTGTLVYGQKDKLIATIGLSDMVVVDTPDALLICPLSKAQDVKEIVDELKKKKKEKFL